MNWTFFRLNEEHFTFHLQYKCSGTFGNRKYEELSYPKKAENVWPYSSNSLKMRPHYSQSSLENPTPSSDTFLLASDKEVPPTPRADMLRRLSTHEYYLAHSIFLHAQREGRVVIFRPHHLHRLSFDTTQFITTSLTSLFAGIFGWSLSWPSGSLAIVFATGTKVAVTLLASWQIEVIFCWSRKC